MLEDFEENPEYDVLNLVEQYEAVYLKNKKCFFTQEEFEQIILYYEEKCLFHQVLEATGFAISQYPFSVEFLIRQANALIATEKHKEALETLHRALLYDPTNIDIYVLQSDAYLLMDDHQQATESIKRAIQIAPKQDLDFLYLELAAVYEEIDDFEHTYSYLSKVLESNPQNEEALTRIWFAVELTEKYAESYRLHKSIIDRYPYSYLAWFNYAHSNFGLGLLEKAVDAFGYVIAINEDFELAYRDCGDALFHLGKYNEAIEHYNKVIELFKPYEELYYCMGLCYEKMKSYAKAREHFRKATHLNPQFADAFFRIAENYRFEQRWINAVTAYERALKLEEKNISYLTSYADAHRELSNMEEAISCYEEAIELNPNIKANWIKLANLYFEEEDIEQAVAVMDEAEIKCSKGTDFSYYKSAFLFAIGNRQEAIAALEKALVTAYKKHKLLFKILPSLQNDDMVLNIIGQYSNGK